MSRTLLGLAALLCLVTLANAQATIVQSVYMSTASCSGFAISNTTVATTGQCLDNMDLSWRSMFCSNDGTTIYTIIYDDMNCTSARAYSMAATTPECQAAGTSSYIQRCMNPSAGPAAPLSFPPTDWSSVISCRNMTDPSAPMRTCTAGGAIKCDRSAYNTGFCHKVGGGVDGSIVQIGSAATYCAADGSAAGQVMFSDNSCQTPVKANLLTTGCNDGTQVSCAANAATLPTLPNQGYTQFDNDNCVVNPFNAPTVTLFASGCVDSESFTCLTVNGTSAATLSEFTDSTRKGLCPAATKMDTTQFTGACVMGKIFTCEYAPPSGGNSASAASTSVVVMIVAAFVAMVAGRSL